MANKVKSVSIPFKREGVSKGRQAETYVVTLDDRFRFPSNGKVYPKTREK